MADIPVNEKLYAMIVGQAKAKYRIYPSPGASHWVHRRYLEMGGKFVDSEVLAQRKELMKHAHDRMEARRRGEDHKDPRHIKDDKKHEDKK
ncbi:hypothetical protein UFOVP111_105 [uncultured Caudovirales phage]|uniref:Uncharacterized protein n=1 Tax=uncultured Caudovirales phage TaxID=2100421 RepID=A0A6J5L3J0_9CAUD|nr:hypothetical protein UFOVP111_105 [uncultured Caudovirales phage]